MYAHSKTYSITLVLLCLIAAYMTCTTIWMFTHHYELKKSGGDGVLFLHLLYNLQHGNGLSSSLLEGRHWFSYHFSPILYLIYPLYLLYPHVELLYVLHTFLFSLAAIPIFLTCRLILKNEIYALTLTCLYFLNPFTLNAAIWDFHEIAFAPCIIACLLWSFFKPSRLWSTLFSLCLLCIKTHYGLSIFGLGIAWAWKYKDYRFASGLMALGIGALALVLGVIMPHFSPTGAAMMISSSSDIDRYSWVRHPFSDPRFLLTQALSAFFYALLLLLPFLLFPLHALPILLIASADIAANILSANSMMRSPTSYHSAAIIPVLVIATAYVLTFGSQKIADNQRFWLLSIAVLSLWFSHTIPSIPYWNDGNVWEFTAPKLSYDTTDKAALDAIEQIIPRGAKVSVQNNVIPHIAMRRELYHFPNRYQDSDYVVLHTGQIFKHSTQVFGIPYSTQLNDYFPTAFKLLHADEWGVVFFAHHWLVLKKYAPQHRQLQLSALADLSATKAALDALKSVNPQPSSARH